MHHKFIFIFLLLITHLIAQDNLVEFGIKTTAFSYTERDDNDQILNTEESTFFQVGGVYGSIDLKFESYDKPDYHVDYYLDLYTSIEYGNTDYTGSALFNSQGYGSLTSRTFNHFYEFQSNIKRVITSKEHTHFILLGLGYKEWQRKLSSKQIENYNFVFAHIGIGGNINIYQNYLLGLEMSTYLAFNPSMEADFVSASGQGLHESFKLGTTYGYRVGVPFTIPIDKRLSFKTKLEYEFESIGKSNKILVPNFPNTGDSFSFLEPKSQQKNWHLYAGLLFTF